VDNPRRPRAEQCRKIVKLMNGEVQYIRDSEISYFLISLELLVFLGEVKLEEVEAFCFH